MTGGNRAFHALGQSGPCSDADISDARIPLTSAMPLASASNASNPIQKAVKDGSTYDAEHPIAAGMSALEPAARTLIGQGSESGEAKKALSLPFKTVPAVSLSPKAAPSAASEAARGHASPASATEQSPLTPMPAGKLKPLKERFTQRPQNLRQSPPPLPPDLTPRPRQSAPLRSLPQELRPKF